MAQSPSSVQEQEKPAGVLPDQLAILPLKNLVVFPASVAPMRVESPSGIQAVNDAAQGNRIIGVVAQRDPEADEPGPEALHRVGTAAAIVRMLRLPDGGMQLLLQGVTRIEFARWEQTKPFLKAAIRVPDIDETQTDEIQGLTRSIMHVLNQITQLASGLNRNLYMLAMNIDQPGLLADFIASSLPLPFEEQQALLETYDLKTRLEKLSTHLNRELKLSELSSKIQSDVQSKLEKTQREYLLREQMNAIRKELGEDGETTKDVKELGDKIDRAGLPEPVLREARKELDRLTKIPPASPEYTVILTYLDLLVSLPWSVTTPDNLDVEQARRVLDEDHFDLEKIKERILEFIAVRKLKGNLAGSILCFAGPPGVGKTSLGKSIARAMGRQFIRVSLGGIRDEADIRGHRRTYIGAMPGRIIQSLRRAGSNNPVFMLDEIDKVGMDFRGDPASALLEVLDPEQNNAFTDHYLDQPFDLSKVMFITTANITDTIPGPLLDRMEVIRLSGYTEDEKRMIAKTYLVPKQVKNHGLQEGQLTFTDGALARIIRDYTREAGLRNLEREIASVCRKAAFKLAAGATGSVVIQPDDVSAYVGPVRFFSEVAERSKQPGVVIGLAWTPAGGDIMFIEATKMPGKKTFTLTGQLGEVMKESAQAALSYIRSQAGRFGIAEQFFETTDLHIHVPAGAIPKDGPSAGVTMAVALASLLTGRPVKPFVAMTGEITLRGAILPVGGIKEKVLAAKRAGIHTIFVPKKNEQDLEELAPQAREGLTFRPVEDIAEVIEQALL